MHPLPALKECGPHDFTSNLLSSCASETPGPGVITGALKGFMERPYTIYIFTNGMVATFDRNGKQIPEFQGTIFEAIAALADADLTGLREIQAQNICPDMLREAQQNYKRAKENKE